MRRYWFFVIGYLILIPFHASGAVYIVGGPETRIAAGQEVSVILGVDTEGTRLNLFSAKMNVPDGLEFVSFDIADSIVNIWIQEPKFQNDTRTVYLIGGVPGGFLGRASLVRVRLRALTPGNYTLTIDPSSEAYVNDGIGSLAPLTFEAMNLEVEKSDNGRDRRLIAFGIAGIIILLMVVFLLYRFSIRKKSRPV